MGRRAVDIHVFSEDSGWEDFEEKMKDLSKGHSITVGVHAKDAPRAEDGPNNAELLRIHEFGATIQHPGGTPYVIGPDGRAHFVSEEYPDPDGYTDPHTIRIPARPVLRGTLSENRFKISDLMKRQIRTLLLRGSAGRIKEFLAPVGKYAKSTVLAKFGSSGLKPNAAETIRKKGHGMPMIETGQLAEAIDFEVNIDIGSLFEAATPSLGGEAQSIDASQF